MLSKGRSIDILAVGGGGEGAIWGGILCLGMPLSKEDLLLIYFYKASLEQGTLMHNDWIGALRGGERAWEVGRKSTGISVASSTYPNWGLNLKPR